MRIPRGVTAPLRLDKKHFTAPHGVERSLTASLITNPDLRGYSAPTPDLPGGQDSSVARKGQTKKVSQTKNHFNKAMKKSLRDQLVMCLHPHVPVAGREILP